MKTILTSIALLIAILGVIWGFFDLAKGIQIIVDDIVLSLFVGVLLNVLGNHK